MRIESGGGGLHFVTERYTFEEYISVCLLMGLIQLMLGKRVIGDHWPKGIFAGVNVFRASCT
jgi:hypothetical protein